MYNRQKTAKPIYVKDQNLINKMKESKGMAMMTMGILKKLKEGVAEEMQIREIEEEQAKERTPKVKLESDREKSM